jgi:hypothetical protein
MCTIHDTRPDFEPCIEVFEFEKNELELKYKNLEIVKTKFKPSIEGALNKFYNITLTLYIAQNWTLWKKYNCTITGGH